MLTSLYLKYIHRSSYADLMRRIILLLVSLSLSLNFATVEVSAQTIWPIPTWQTATPAEMGMDATKLEEAKNYALSGGGSGIITRGGKVVMTWGSQTQKYNLKS